MVTAVVVVTHLLTEHPPCSRHHANHWAPGVSLNALNNPILWKRDGDSGEVRCLPWSEVRAWLSPGAVTPMSCAVLAGALGLVKWHFLQQKRKDLPWSQGFPSFQVCELHFTVQLFEDLFTCWCFYF